MNPPKKNLRDTVTELMTDWALKLGGEMGQLRSSVNALADEVTVLRLKLQAPEVTPPPKNPELPFSCLPVLNEAEIAIIKTGAKIDAIKAFRARVDSLGFFCGLKNAKDQIEAYQTKVLPVLNNIPLPALNSSELKLLMEGNLVKAVQTYRARIQAEFVFTPSLKEAKELMEATRDTLKTKGLVDEGGKYALPLGITAEVITLMKAGKKTEAAKVYRYEINSATGQLPTHLYALSVIDSVMSKASWIWAEPTPAVSPVAEVLFPNDAAPINKPETADQVGITEEVIALTKAGKLGSASVAYGETVEALTGSKPSLAHANAVIQELHDSLAWMETKGQLLSKDEMKALDAVSDETAF